MAISDVANRAELHEELPEELPAIIPGSQLQLDGDICCYRCSWPDRSLSEDIKNLKKHIEVKRLMTGSETVLVHTTNGGKSGREDIAMINAYQVKRNISDPDKAERVRELRTFLTDYKSDTVLPVANWEYEADDSMSMCQRYANHTGIISKIMTVDKDLDMVPGTHVDYDEYTEEEHADFGKLYIKETIGMSNGKEITKRKVKGQGTKFFWAQVLMGDSADSIPGLPNVSRQYMNKLKPTKKVLTAQTTLKNPKATKRAKETANKILADIKPVACGQMLAYTILEKCTNDWQCYTAVTRAYISWYGRKPFDLETWRGDTFRVTIHDMLLEQASLLWMLRWKNDSAETFIDEIINIEEM